MASRTACKERGVK